jgi:predicted nucleic acid-binding protein
VVVKKSKQKILLDADVIIHFVKGERLLDLPKIFKEEKVILDIVCQELMKRRDLAHFYENLIRFGLINEISFKTDLSVLREYARLKKKYGDGESACMAYCKFNKDILASSNLRDIKSYCEENEIQYLTTMDFIAEALHSGLWSAADCDFFIYNVKSKGSKLPVNKISEYFRK